MFTVLSSWHAIARVHLVHAMKTIGLSQVDKCKVMHFGHNNLKMAIGRFRFKETFDQNTRWPGI